MSDIQAINSELQNFYNWTLINKLSLNLSKTCAMIIKSPNNRTDLTLYQQLTLGGGPLSFVSSTKFLGVTIDDRLSWKPQIDSVCKKLRSKVLTFKHIRPVLDVTTMILIYNAFVLPHLYYSLETWGSASNTLENKIMRIQKSYVRIMHNTEPLTHIPPLFKKSKILNIKLLYSHKLLLNTYRYFNQRWAL